MIGSNRLSSFSWVVATMVLLAAPPVFSQEYTDLITEEYLRTQFAFTDGDKLKYAECVKKSYPTCTYIWGVESKQDANRVKYGLAPAGNKLMVIYAQAKNPKDFDRVTSTYSDAEKVDGIGTASVWSSQRNQLSFITDSSLIVHINIDEEPASNSRASAISIARYLLKKL